MTSDTMDGKSTNIIYLLCHGLPPSQLEPWLNEFFMKVEGVRSLNGCSSFKTTVEFTASSKELALGPTVWPIRIRILPTFPPNTTRQAMLSCLGEICDLYGGHLRVDCS